MITNDYKNRKYVTKKQIYCKIKKDALRRPFWGYRQSIVDTPNQMPKVGIWFDLCAARASPARFAGGRHTPGFPVFFAQYTPVRKMDLNFFGFAELSEGFSAKRFIGLSTPWRGCSKSLFLALSQIKTSSKSYEELQASQFLITFKAYTFLEKLFCYSRLDMCCGNRLKLLPQNSLAEYRTVTTITLLASSSTR